MNAPAELHVTVARSEAELVSGVLWRSDPNAIEERPAAEDRITLVAGFRDRLDADGAAHTLVDMHPRLRLDVSVTEIADESWLDRWRDHAEPVRVGRFLLTPAWLDVEATDGLDDDEARATVPIRLDPGRAFGSGSHETTRLVLGAVDRLVSADTAVLDVGCGSGVLSVAAAALGAGRVVAIDVDPAAVAATIANAAGNGLADRIDVTSDPLHSIDGSFDVVLANLLGSTIAALSDDLIARVAPRGHLVLSGLLADRWETTAACFPGWRVASVDAEGD